MKTFPRFEPHFPWTQWTLPAILEHQAVHRAEEPFLRWESEGAFASFAEVNREANRLAHGLRRKGVKKGDRIVIFLPNSVDFVHLYFAINKLGAVQAPINTAYKGRFLEHQVDICAAGTIVASDELLPRVLESLPRMPTVRRLVVWTRGAASTQPLPVVDRIEVCRFDDLRAQEDGNPDSDVRPQDLAAIMFTSGTTGLSKGVLMPHAQIHLFAEECAQLSRLTEDDVYLSALPLFHANAQLLTVYCSLITGGRCVLFERFHAGEWVNRLHATGATVTNCVGAMLGFIHALPPSPDDATHRLRSILAGPTPWEIHDAIKARFGVRDIVEAYGQTEINLPFLTLIGEARPRGAVGVLVDQWFEVRLVDPETDLDVPDGQVGELLVRPRVPWTLNQGYANMPEKTAEAFRNLWFHTGDALRRDADGWFYFLDRFKDTLRRRGENISSFEVESPIREHPAVADVAIVAVPADVDGGEDEVKACVVLKPGRASTPEELLAWCEPRMPYFVVPRYLEFMDALPTSASEKVQKNVLRAAGVTDRTWDRVRAGYRLAEEVARASQKQVAQAARTHAAGAGTTGVRS